MQENPMISPHPVASWRRYVILGGLVLLLLSAGLAIWQNQRRLTNTNQATNQADETVTTPDGSRATFERFQATVNRPTTNTPTTSQPTKEQTQEAIKQLQQQ